MRIRASIAFAASAAALFMAAPAAQAHFLELLPSTDIVSAGDDRTLSFDIVFTHPMARGPAMEMAKPVRVGVLGNGKTSDLTGQIESAPVDGKSAWRLSYDVKEPGGYVFFVEPQPYWEPAEGKMIVHYSKVVVDAFDWGDGWDELVGFPSEIQPLTRPFGFWTGNSFRGIALKNGKPVPFAEVEVEWVNDGSVTPPAGAFETQVIKADAQGVFAYTVPRAGWWGFAVLVEADEPMKAPDGKDVPVELGGLMWIRAVDMK